MGNKTINLHILNQDKVWLPYGADKPMKLKDMEPSHVANLLAFLERKKRTMKQKVEYYWMMVAAHHDGGEMAQDSLDSIADRLINQSADEWFNEQPLIVELRRLKAKYDKTLCPSSFVAAVEEFVAQK